MYSRISGLTLVFVLVGSMLLVLLAEGCSTTAPSDTSQTAAISTKAYGSLVIGGSFGTGQVNPQFGSSADYRGLGFAIFDTLAYTNDKDELLGGIAERWEIAPDGKTQTFYIRKGVKFHNGDDLTGADVKFSFERMLKPETTQTSIEQWRALIASVSLKDDYTVLVQLKTASYDLLPNLSYLGVVMPKKYIEEKGDDFFNKNPMGSGPWKFLSYVPGTRLELEAVESHWRTTPQFRTLTLLGVKEEGTRLAMLKTGELDAAAIKVDWVPDLQKAGLQIKKSGHGARFFAWPWYDLENPGSSPFGDVNVRKALALGINSKEIADTIYKGYGGPYALLPMVASSYFNDPIQVKPDAYDPEGAKKLLAAAGFPNGFDTKIWDIGGEQSLVAQAESGYFRKIGVNAQITAMDFATLRTKYRPKLLPEVMNTIFNYSSPTVNYTSDVFSFATWFHSKIGSSMNINNPALDQLIEKVPLTADPAQKKQIAIQAAVMAKNGYTSIPVVEAFSLMASGPKIGEAKRVETEQEGLMAITYENLTHAK
ncbi:MAG: ABC transporter substrate-binding protein [Dehalococcoidia bacterium]|nr:ABC transporter substrate-binding protein [Dehalococcoidia bacterium]